MFVKKISRKLLRFLQIHLIELSAILLTLFVISWPLSLTCKMRVIASESLVGILGIIITSISSILGIIVAIQLVAFEVLRKSFSSFAFSDFFDRNHSKILLNRYIFTILYSLLTLAYIKDPPNDFNYISTYISIILFFYCLITLYPSIKIILSQSKAIDGIKRVVEKITHEKLEELGCKLNADEASEMMESNPIFLLSDYCIRCIDNEDRIGSRVVINYSSKKMFDMLLASDNSNDAREYITKFFLLYNSVFEKANNLHHNGLLYSIIEVVHLTYRICSDKKFKWYSMNGLNIDFNRMIIMLIESRNLDISLGAIDKLAKIYIEQIRTNLPDERKISILNIGEKINEEDFDPEASTQWEMISTTLLRNLDTISEFAISKNNVEVLNSCLHAFASIISAIHLMKIGDKMKHHILVDCFRYMKDSLVKASASKLVKENLQIFPYHFMGLERIIGSSKIYSRGVLQIFGSTYVELGRKDQLPLFNINDIGMLGRMLQSRISQSKFVEESIIYLINVLLVLMKIYKSVNAINYLIEIKRQAISIKEWFKDDADKYCDFVNIMDNKILEFNNINIPENENNDRNWYDNV